MSSADANRSVADTPTTDHGAESPTPHPIDESRPPSEPATPPVGAAETGPGTGRNGATAPAEAEPNSGSAAEPADSPAAASVDGEADNDAATPDRAPGKSGVAATGGPLHVETTAADAGAAASADDGTEPAEDRVADTGTASASTGEPAEVGNGPADDDTAATAAADAGAADSAEDGPVDDGSADAGLSTAAVGSGSTGSAATTVADGRVATTLVDGEAADSAPTEPEDPETGRWRKFASTEPSAEPEPAAWHLRVLRRTGRALRGETAIAALVSVVLSLSMNWKVLRDPLHTIPHDLGDPLLQTYTLAWPGEVLFSQPGQLFNASNFYPNRLSFAFTDTLLGYLPASLIGSGHEAALLRYNVLYLFTYALAFFGAYVLLRQLGARVAGSAVGAAAIAYAPWKLAQAGHLHILSIGGIMLALAMLARGHGYSLRHGYRPKHTRWGWAIGGWLVAAWQVSIGFGVGVGFGYLLGGIVIVSMLIFGFKNISASLNKRVGPRIPWRVLVADGVGMLVFGATSLILAIPFFEVLNQHPEAERSLDEVGFFSPVWSSFLISPEESAIWGEAHAGAREGMPWPPEMTLLVGFTLLALAVVGLVWSAWTPRQRVFLALGTAVSVALALGTNFLDRGAWAYGLAYEYLPGFDGLRTPGRLVFFTSLFLVVLAAGTLTKLADSLDGYATMDRVDARFRPSVPAPLRAALLLPLVLVLLEGYSSAEIKKVPEPPVAMAKLADPVLILPSDGWHDSMIQYWSVDGFPRIVNGTAGFTPSNQDEIRQHALTFPSERSVAELRADGVKTVVAVRDLLDGSQWDYLLDIPSRDPTVTVEDRGKVLIFTL